MDEDTSLQIEDVLLSIEIIEDSIGETVEKLQGGDKENVELKDLESSTSQVFDLIEFAKREVGKSDIRTIQGKDFISCLNKFVELSSGFDTANKAQKNISILTKSTKQLQKLISRPWNTSLGINKSAESADRGESSGAGAGAMEENSCEDGWEFKSTKNVAKAEFECDQCQPRKKFTAAKSFRTHKKKIHDVKVNVEIPKIKCMLPHDAGSRVRDEHPPDYMATHLLQVHKKPKPSKDHFFRGWLTRNGGNTWEPVFLKDSEQDPTTPGSYPALADKPEPAASGNDEKKKVEEEEQAANESLTPGVDENVEEERQKGPVNISKSQSNLNDESQISEGNSQQVITERQETLTSTIVSSQLAEATAAQVNEGLLESVESDQDTGTDRLEKGELEKSNSKGKVVGNRKPEPIAVIIAEQASDLMDLQVATVTKQVEPEPSKVAEDTTALESEASEKPADENENPEDIESLMYIEDEIYNSDPSNLELTTNEVENLEVHDSSDIEEDDSENFKANLLSNKLMRWNKRSSLDKEVHPSKIPENAQFRAMLTQFVVDESASKNPEISTVTFTQDLITDHDDSFLVYMIKLDPTFSLPRLINFNHPDFLELQDPKVWVSQISGQDRKGQPTRRKEMLKAWCRLNRFIEEKLKEDSTFGTDWESKLRRRELRDSLRDQIKDLEKSKIWGELKVQIAHNKKEIAAAEEILNPTEYSSTNDANKIYFNSKEFNARVESNTQIWKKAMETNSVGTREFSKVGIFTKHYMFLQDRNRSAGYTMTNADYCAKKAIYFPPGHNYDNFDGIPDSVDIYTKPHPDAIPDGYIIKVPGSRKGVKLQDDITITVLRDVHEWLCRYRDLKSILFGDEAMVPDEQFFVNFYKGQRKPFGKLINYPGSILDEFSKVTNQRHVTTNKVRASLEPTIQSSHAMKTRSRVVGSHSHETGHRYYDQSQSAFRMSSLHFINTQEGVDNTEKIDEEVPEAVAAKRRKIAEEDESSKIERAKQILGANSSRKRNVKAGVGTCKLDPENRSYLQQAFSEDGVLKDLRLFDGKFPGVKRFKRIFFRIVDGRPHSFDLPKEDLERLLKIEEVTFGVVKEKVEKQENASWVSSVQSNHEADHEIARILHSSLKSYETNKKDGDRKFFSF